MRAVLPGLTVVFHHFCKNLQEPTAIVQAGRANERFMHAFDLAAGATQECKPQGRAMLDQRQSGLTRDFARLTRPQSFSADFVVLA